MRGILIIMLLFSIFRVEAQQGLQMEFTEKDSAQMKLEREIQYRQLISGALNPEFMVDKIELPGFNFNDELKNRYSLNIEALPFSRSNFGIFSSGINPTFHNPFYHNGTILSSAAYQIGDKFTMGGYSFGANSIFSAPFPNQGLNNFDTHGSTLFMQYKVSKKFKIETRISVTQDHGNRF